MGYDNISVEYENTELSHVVQERAEGPKAFHIITKKIRIRAMILLATGMLQEKIGRKLGIFRFSSYLSSAIRKVRRIWQK